MLPTRAALVLVACLLTTACAAGSGPQTFGSPPPGGRHQMEIVQEAADATTGPALIDPFEIENGGPAVDGIPAIDEPVLVSAAEASNGLVESEQVLLVARGSRALAFPLRSLVQHEIANAELAGLPIAATWCPLCNTGAVYERTLDGRVTTFGVTGGLYRSAMVMYDRETRSMWTQPTGRAVLGTRAGRELTPVPSSLLSWAQATRSYPDVQVVVADRAQLRYSTNPYGGYDSSEVPFAFRGKRDQRLPAFERVTGVSFDGRAVAWPFSLLREQGVAERSLSGRPIVVLWSAGSASPLDEDDVRTGRDVGSASIYSPVVDGKLLRFTRDGDDFRDEQTQSTWTVGGLAVSGPLRGARLDRLPSQDAFWFAWAAFNADTEIAQASR